MLTLLHIDSSAIGENPISRRLTREFVNCWLSANPGGKVIRRDLATTAIPPVTAEWIAANLTPKESRTPKQNDVLALSTELTSELLQADEYVIGLPIHNWGPAASFKLWVDQIVRFGETIAATPSGPKGTLGEKRATFVIAAGRSYRPGSPDAPKNYVEPWLRTLFGYLGLKEMQFILADGAAAARYGRMNLETFLAPHIAAVQAIFTPILSS